MMVGLKIVLSFCLHVNTFTFLLSNKLPDIIKQVYYVK